MSELKPGPLTLAGLRWLAAVGSVTVGGLGLAMGWSRPVTYSHAKRLRDAGWVETCRRVYGEGSLGVCVACWSQAVRCRGSGGAS